MSQLQCNQLNKLSLAFGKFNIFISKCELKLNLDIVMQLKCYFNWNGIQKFFAKTNKSDGDFTEICKLICKECEFIFDKCEIRASLSEILEADIDIKVKNNRLEFVDAYSDYAYTPITTATSDYIDTSVDYSSVAYLNGVTYNKSNIDISNIDVTDYATLAEKNKIETGADKEVNVVQWTGNSIAGSITADTISDAVAAYNEGIPNDKCDGTKPKTEAMKNYVWDGSSLTEKDAEKLTPNYYEKYIKDKYKPTDNKWAKWQEENIAKIEEPVPKIEPKEEPKDRFDLLDMD